MKDGPIIIVEDDHDDQEILREVIISLNVSNEIKFFDNSVKAFDYLLSTSDKPFLIISDVNLPMMTGNELKRKINENEYLKMKCIPFIFLTTTAASIAIEEAYKMMVQGYFVKPNTIKEISDTLAMIIDYWRLCKDPNSE